MSDLFANLASTAKAAEKPATRKPSVPELTDSVKAFAKQVAEAPHGLDVPGLDKTTRNKIQKTLSAHAQALFGALRPRIRWITEPTKTEPGTVRITLSQPSAKPAA